MNCISNAIFAVIGNKSDLYTRAQVDEKEAIDWADSIGAIFQLTSAKSNSGIDLLFTNIAKRTKLKFEFLNHNDLPFIFHDEIKPIHPEYKHQRYFKHCY